ncbi:glucosaminidase domain-containing protein [Flavobacterium nackdongense]|uniref:Peptidoglycan hydrolase n=1 Tax=Flavobacterium nackdongense TaxID=2547394 RepID=A0A4P6Y9E4_9FLAO|nr:glucosaminidase domain-containing protein [Flavobacterium nackdongense]QBN18628.1 LysM peptidoglycan-binding domain-containing protein [Flavobacterium nackdongense]
MYKKIVLLVVILFLTGCSNSKSVIVTPKKTATSQKKVSGSEVIESTSKTVVTSDLINGYVFHYKDIAMSNMKNYGIPASIILAQGILESGAGQGKLATTANNHFGIKCYTDWKGETTLHDDDATQECFRKYGNAEESYQDHAAIVSKRTRYASLFKLEKGDYKGWAKGLKAAGYATDPKYPEKLISYIERYHLDQYDNQVLGKAYFLDKSQNARAVVVSDEKANLYEVKKGDTLYSISKKFNISIEDLKKQNNIFDNAISIGQNLKIQ